MVEHSTATVTSSGGSRASSTASIRGTTLPPSSCRTSARNAGMIFSSAVLGSFAPHPPATRVPPSPRTRGEGWGEGHPLLCAERLEDADEIGDGGAAHIKDAGKRGVRHLDAARLTGHLHRGQHMHRDAGRADRVTLRFEPARGVDRELAVLLGPPFEDRARSFALWRQPH